MTPRAVIIGALFLAGMSPIGTTKAQGLLNLVAQCVAQEALGKPTAGCPMVNADPKTG